MVKEIISKDGLLTTLSRTSKDRLQDDVNLTKRRETNTNHIAFSEDELTVKHFWAEETYKDEHFLKANESFVNPEILITLAHSDEDSIRAMFSNPVNKQVLIFRQK